MKAFPVEFSFWDGLDDIKEEDQNCQQKVEDPESEQEDDGDVETIVEEATAPLEVEVSDIQVAVVHVRSIENEEQVDNEDDQVEEILDEVLVLAHIVNGSAETVEVLTQKQLFLLFVHSVDEVVDFLVMWFDGKLIDEFGTVIVEVRQVGLRVPQNFNSLVVLEFNIPEELVVETEVFFFDLLIIIVVGLCSFVENKEIVSSDDDFQQKFAYFQVVLLEIRITAIDGD
jgi:hypothetical protein